MKDLVQMLQEKAGVTEEQAIKSVETVKEFIQSKLPPMMHGMVDNFMVGLGQSEDDDFVDGGNSGDDWGDIARNVSDEATGKLGSDGKAKPQDGSVK